MFGYKNILHVCEPPHYAYAPNELIFLLLSALKGDTEIIRTGRIWTTCWLQDNIHTMRLKALAEKFFHKTCYMRRENNLWEHEQLALCKKEIMHLTWSLYLTSIKDYPHEWNSTWKLTRDLNCIMRVEERSWCARSGLPIFSQDGICTVRPGHFLTSLWAARCCYNLREAFVSAPKPNDKNPWRGTSTRMAPFCCCC